MVNARAALLSNYEVLSLLKDLEEDHINRTKALQKLKKDDEQAGISIPGNTGSVLETSENLRTIEVEVRLDAFAHIIHDETTINPGDPIPHIRLPPCIKTNRRNCNKARRKPSPIRPHQS